VIALQHRFDLDLRDPHRRLTRHAAVVALADQAPPLRNARIAEAMQLMTAQRRDPGNVEIVVLRHRNGAQRIDQPEPPEQLHAAGVGDVHLGIMRGAGVALDQHAGDAASRQLAGQRHADGTAAGNEHGNGFHGPARRRTAAVIIRS
jgi:hypothetical protein